MEEQQAEIIQRLKALEEGNSLLARYLNETMDTQMRILELLDGLGAKSKKTTDIEEYRQKTGKKSAYTSWLYAENLELARNYGENQLSTYEISEIHGRSPGAISSQIRKLTEKNTYPVEDALVWEKAFQRAYKEFGSPPYRKEVSQ